jgi:uncharacterized glyoxalase superfamily protein PhnB
MVVVGVEAGIVGRDEPALIAFYVQAMRFDVLSRYEFPVGVVCRLARGEARLKIFFPTEEIAASPDPNAPWFAAGGWRYAALLLDDLAAVDELSDAMLAAGGRVILAPANHRPGARMAMVTDPEGNAWELLADRG